MFDAGFPSLRQASLLGTWSPVQREAEAGCSEHPFWPGQAAVFQSGKNRVIARDWGLLSWDSFLRRSPGK